MIVKCTSGGLQLKGVRREHIDFSANKNPISRCRPNKSLSCSHNDLIRCPAVKTAPAKPAVKKKKKTLICIFSSTSFILPYLKYGATHINCNHMFINQITSFFSLCQSKVLKPG